MSNPTSCCHVRRKMEDDSKCRKKYNIKDHDMVSPELSELISVREFKEQLKFVYICQMSEGLDGTDLKDIQHKIGIDDDTFSKCTENCNAQKLFPEGGLSEIQHKKRKELPKETGLESVDNVFSIDLLPTVKRMIHPIATTNSLCNISTSQVQCPEAILSVLVYHPIKMMPFAQYIVLASQSLVQLRDKLYCPRDYAVEHDYSANPDVFDRTSLPIPSKSAYFFINNTFYNDTRYPHSIDYSSLIIKWANEPLRQSQSPRLAQFKSDDMLTTNFEDLSIRLGYPYLYCHHGNCEHAIVFTDLRLFTSVDAPNIDSYPLLSGFAKDPRKKCCVCEQFTATWVTISDHLAAESPSYFCQTCFKMLHYNKNGEKLSNFLAYPYFDETTTLLETQFDNK